jgi:hypothetical protein
MNKIALTVDLKHRNAHGESAIHSASMGANLVAVTFLLDHGVSANEPTAQGETPLHYATRVGRRDLVEFLISRGGDPRCLSASGQSPLDIAKEYQMKEIITMMEAVPLHPKQTRSGTLPLSSSPKLNIFKKTSRSKSEVNRAISRRSPGIEKKEDEKEKLIHKFSRKITYLMSKEVSGSPPIPSLASYEPGINLSEIPNNDIIRIGNFPLWRSDLDSFGELLTIAITKKNFLIFEMEASSSILRYCVPREEVGVRAVPYPIGSHEFVFDIFFPLKSQTIFLRLANTSSRGREEWLTALGPEKKRDPIPVCVVLLMCCVVDMLCC